MNDDGNNSAGPQRRPGLILFTLFIIVICAPIHLALLYKNVGDICDDAMISARYARNLAHGHGLRYNRVPEDARPVEGYSNFLWVVGMAIGEKMRAHPRIYTLYMGGVSSLISIFVLGFWVRSRTGSSPAGAIAALILATSLPYAVWSVRGLETPLFALLVLFAVAVTRPDEPGLTKYFLAFLACLARPDGLIIAAAIIIAQLISPCRDLRRIVLKSSLAFGLPFIIYTVWRWSHFGMIVPNVFHAKTGLGAAGVLVGIRYVLDWALKSWPLTLLLLIGLIPLVWRRKSYHELSPIHAPVILTVLYLGFMVAVGGDFMPDHRFVMHLVPVIIGFAVIGCYNLFGTLNFRFFIAKKVDWLFFLLALVLIGNGWWILDLFIHRKGADTFPPLWHKDQAKWYGRASSWLLRHTDIDDVIACGDIGYIGYVTDVDRILDTNGLVDSYLARLPGAAAFDTDPKYVLDEQPDFLVVMVHYFEKGEVIGHTAFDRAVMRSERLDQEFTLAVEVPGWQSMQRSFDDGITRSSTVQFRIYKSKGK